MQVRKGWMLALTFLCSCLLNPGVASSSSSSATPSPSSTPSPSLTPSPGATPSPSGTPAPTSATPSPGGSSSSTSSSSTSSSSASSSSGTSRGTVVAWAFFTVLFGVALLMFLYNREQNKRLRAQRGDLLRQSLASNDTMNPPYHQPEPLPGHKPDPTMSSF